MYYATIVISLIAYYKHLMDEKVDSNIFGALFLIIISAIPCVNILMALFLHRRTLFIK